MKPAAGISFDGDDSRSSLGGFGSPEAVAGNTDIHRASEKSRKNSQGHWVVKPMGIPANRKPSVPPPLSTPPSSMLPPAAPPTESHSGVRKGAQVKEEVSRNMSDKVGTVNLKNIHEPKWKPATQPRPKLVIKRLKK